jgi:hypothetical protein
MLFILIAWLLVVLTFAIWLRALHSIPIYTHTPLQQQEQTLQIQNVSSITQMLLALAIACVGLHFALPSDVLHLQTPHVRSTASMNASAMAHGHNFSS